MHFYNMLRNFILAYYNNVFPFPSVWPKIATPASELDDGIKADLEASAIPMDADAVAATGNTSQGGSPITDEHQKQSSDTDGQEVAGHSEPDADVEPGMVDGEADTEVDLDAVG